MSSTPSDDESTIADLYSPVGKLQLGGGEMLVDDYDQYNEKQDVATISDEALEDAEAEPEPLATDRTQLDGNPLSRWTESADEL